MSREIVEALHALGEEKGIDPDVLTDALSDALLSAYRKTPGAARYAKVELDSEAGDYRVYELILPADLEEKLLDEVWAEEEAKAEEAGPKTRIDPETGEPREFTEPEISPARIEPYMDQVTARDVTPENFGRIAAQTAKQVILQRIREAERAMMYEEFRDRVGELVTGTIQQSDNRYTLVQLRDRVEALLPRSEQVYRERYDHNMRIKAVITDVPAEGKGPSIVVSRKSPELIKKLFELEVPEIADGLVEVVGVAREPGWRSKIAVISHADGVDPVGACVGPRGSRVRMVVSELRGEKIDIIPYNEEPARFIAKALSPARVREVFVDDENRQATVVVPDDQLSLAIGREGQNARLAAKLTGWKVDITSEADAARSDEELGGEDEEELDGRCAAMLSGGRRCPNASLGGSRFCGLPQHQALARFATNDVAMLVGLNEAELAILADPDAPEGEIGPLVERAESTYEPAPPPEDEPDEDEEASETDDEPEPGDDAEAGDEPEAADEPETEEGDAPEAEVADEPEPDEEPEPDDEDPADDSDDDDDDGDDSDDSEEAGDGGEVEVVQAEEAQA